MPRRFRYLFECSAGCGYRYESPIKLTYLQCPNPAHYPRLASKSVEAKLIDQKEAS